MFVDIAKITVKSGNGGNGSASFRHEKYVEAGGPDGGDGGRGGSIFFVADPGLRTLMDFKFQRKFEAENGQDGSGGRKHGRDGEDLLIKVPLGTVIKRADTMEMIADIRSAEAPQRILRGGRGGWGNVHYATPTRQSPDFAQNGQKTAAYTLVLELKSIADVGLVGFPNVGKSTLLSSVSGAKPKIANYHFTTLSPNLGVVHVDDTSFNMADIPGLIENAHEGAGLGHDFLRHVERTRVLIHVLDASGSEGRDPREDFEKINAELQSYSKKLAALPQIIAANKCDLPDSQVFMPYLKEMAQEKGIPLFEISAVTGSGVRTLMRAAAKLLAQIPSDDTDIEPAGELESLADLSGFSVEAREDAYYVTGPMASSLLQSVNLEDPASMQYFENRLYDSGVVERLRALGAEHGDTVSFAGMEFEFWD